MSFQSRPERSNCIIRSAFIFALLMATATVTNAAAFTSSSNSEVSIKYKARKAGDLQLGAYKDELIECSALAGIHTWIGDNLNTSGAEVRKTLNRDYWVGISTAYLKLAQQAAGSADLSHDMGVRMRALAAQFRDLTEAPAGTANWGGWYDLIDRCDSWRTEKPAQAFYNNGRKSTMSAKPASEVARAPY